MKNYQFEVSVEHYRGGIKNPIGYRRRTFGSKWNQKSVEYENWKQYVRQCYYLGVNESFRLNKPFSKEKGKVRIEIYFRDETHADPDNIVKGILDSLWDNDKHVDVETKHYCKQVLSTIKVSIEIYE